MDLEAGSPVTPLNDPDRFLALFDERAPQVWRYLRAQLGRSAADDLLSDVFTRAFAARSKFSPERGSEVAWLYGIAHNVCLEHFRRTRKASSALRDLATRARATPASDHSNSVSSQAAVAWALDQLSAERREVVVLIGFFGLTYDEVAEATHVSVGTVKSRYSRARSQLRELLGEDERSTDAG